MKLLGNFIGKGHIVVLNYFYNSFDLTENLLKNQTNMCGTLQADKAGNPQAVVKEGPIHQLSKRQHYCNEIVRQKKCCYHYYYKWS